MANNVYFPMDLSRQDTDCHPYQKHIERAVDEGSMMLRGNPMATKIGIFKLVGIVTPIAPAYDYTPQGEED